MIGTVGALLLWPERTGPVVTDGTGLAVSLVTLAVLAAYQVSTDTRPRSSAWSRRSSPRS